MGDDHVTTDHHVRALRRRTLLAERLVLDLGQASDREMASGLLVQALTTVGGADVAELRLWAGHADGPRSGPTGPSVVLARSQHVLGGDRSGADMPHRHLAIDQGRGLELDVVGDVVPPVAVDRALGALGVALDRIQSEQALLHEARTDVLTGLLNRRAIDERIEGELARIERDGGRLSLLLADLDGFKRVNDTLGHAAGDQLLRGVATSLRGVARAADDVARIGGDEFVLLLPGTGRAGAHVVARRVAEELDQLVDGVTASIGVATVEDGPVPTVGELLRWADDAMYAAKADGERAIVHAEAIR